MRENPGRQSHEDRKVTSTIRDHEWFKQFYGVCEKLMKISMSASDRYYSDHRAIKGPDLEEWFDRLNKFYSECKFKP
tara:strand:- start:649 stop:879 length:231 start_codon:yes stop_codon:yes gene_type:complete